MKPLELLRMSMTALVCGSIFLALHLWPIIAEIIGATLFIGGLCLAGGVVFHLVRAREIERWMKVFGKSHPAKAEILAWRAYTENLNGGLRTTRVRRLDPRYIFFHSTVPHSDVPRRRTSKGPLRTDDRPTSQYWTVN